MSNTYRLTSKGQVTVPKLLRDKYGLKPSTPVEFADENGAIRLYRSSASSPAGRVYGKLGMRMRTDPIVARLRGR